MPRLSLLSLPVFLLLALLQLGFMGYLIVRQEHVVLHGTTYRFLTQSIDPRDPFRGKYIVLHFEAETFRVATPHNWLEALPHRAEVFAHLGTNAEGYAILTGLSPTPPAGDYLPVRVSYYHSNGTVRVELPFDRYYLEETKAKPAEDALRDGRGRDLPCYAVVKVRNGRSALVDVQVDGQSIHQWILGKMEK
mgnify:CR=1 FL=1